MDIKQFLTEDNGNFSSARLAFLLWVIGILVVWIVKSFIGSGDCDLPGIPESVITIIGILMGGKVVQKFKEK